MTIIEEVGRRVDRISNARIYRLNASNAAGRNRFLKFLPIRPPTKKPRIACMGIPNDSVAQFQVDFRNHMLGSPFSFADTYCNNACHRISFLYPIIILGI